MLDHGYLSQLSDTDVIKPEPAALAWLRQMFLPLSMRPWLPIYMVADLMGMTLDQVCNLCLMYNIPLQDDPAFGQLMSVVSFDRFYRECFGFKDPARFDRQALMAFLEGTLRFIGPKMKSLPRLKYSSRLENEISRIAKLPEPERTFRSTALLDAYREARSVVDAWARYKGATMEEPKQIQRLERIVNNSLAD